MANTVGPRFNDSGWITCATRKLAGRVQVDGKRVTLSFDWAGRGRPNPRNGQRQSLVPQANDRIEVRRLFCRVVSEEQSHTHRDRHAERNPYR